MGSKKIKKKVVELERGCQQRRGLLNLTLLHSHIQVSSLGATANIFPGLLQQINLFSNCSSQIFSTLVADRLRLMFSGRSFVTLIGFVIKLSLECETIGLMHSKNLGEV